MGSTKDFKKKRLKVGKAKPLATNATRTSFKSKAIVLPDQPLETDKGDEATSSRHLTLKELLGQVKHYNVNSRRDAVNGLRELLRRQPAVVVARQLGDVLAVVLPLLTDGDKDVRHAMRMLLQQAVLPAIQEDNIVPFMPMFTVYVKSALTHVADDIRLDAVEVLNIAVAAFPRVLARETEQLLTLFLYLLTGANDEGAVMSLAGGPSKKMSSAKGRAAVLGSLCAFLEADQGQGAESVLTSENLLSADKDMFDEPTVPVANFHEFSSLSVASIYLIDPITTLNTGNTKASLRTPDELFDFLNKIMPILLDCWLEYVPSLSAPSTQPGKDGHSALQTLQQVIRVMNRLWRRLVQLAFQLKDVDLIRIAQNYTKDYLKHFILYFPFDSVGAGGAKRSAEVSDILGKMSAEFAETMSLQLYIDPHGDSPIPAETKNSPWIQLTSFVISRLEGKALDGNAAAGSVWSVCWRLLRWVPWHARTLSILQALQQAVNESHSLSQTKRQGIRLLAQFFMGPQGPFDAEQEWHDDAAATQVRRDFYFALPKTIWELGSNDPDTSLMVLRVLTLAVKKELSRENETEVSTHLQNSLAPFFFAVVGQQQQQQQRIRGPFCVLPERVQRATTELLYYMPSMSLKLAQSISSALQFPTNAITSAYLLNVIRLHVQQNDRYIDFDSASGAAFYLSVATGYQMAELRAMQTTEAARDAVIVPPAESKSLVPLWTLLPIETACAIREASTKVADGTKKRKKTDENTPVKIDDAAFWSSRLQVIDVAVAAVAEQLKGQEAQVTTEWLVDLMDGLVDLAVPVDVCVCYARLCLALEVQKDAQRESRFGAHVCSLAAAFVTLLCSGESQTQTNVCKDTYKALASAFPWVSAFVLDLVSQNLQGNDRLTSGFLLLLNDPQTASVWWNWSRDELKGVHAALSRARTASRSLAQTWTSFNLQFANL